MLCESRLWNSLCICTIFVGLPWQSRMCLSELVYSGRKFPEFQNLMKLYVTIKLPTATYMRQWIGPALVQIMACRLFGTTPLSKPMLDYCSWTLRNKIQWHSNQNTRIFIHKNAHENVGCRYGSHFCPGEVELKRCLAAFNRLVAFGQHRRLQCVCTDHINLLRHYGPSWRWYKSFWFVRGVGVLFH